MFDFKFMRTEVVVKPRNEDDAVRVWCESIFPAGDPNVCRDAHRRIITEALIERNLIFECSHGRLHDAIHPTVNFAEEHHGDVQFEAIDLSF